MDSHILRKAAARLPALADLAVLRFNTRGTTSPRGTSDGAFDGGVAERLDVAAAMAFVASTRSAARGCVGWSFGTELVLKYGREHPTRRAPSCSRRRCTAPPMPSWRRGRARAFRWSPLIPELDDYLRPEGGGAVRVGPRRRLVAVEGGKHLWVGEKQTRRVLTEIVAAVNPERSSAADRMGPPGRPARPGLRYSSFILGMTHLAIDDQDAGRHRDRDQGTEQPEEANRPRGPRSPRRRRARRRRGS